MLFFTKNHLFLVAIFRGSKFHFHIVLFLWFENQVFFAFSWVGIGYKVPMKHYMIDCYPGNSGSYERIDPNLEFIRKNIGNNFCLVFDWIVIGKTWILFPYTKDEILIFLFEFAREMISHLKILFSVIIILYNDSLNWILNDLLHNRLKRVLKKWKKLF